MLLPGGVHMLLEKLKTHSFKRIGIVMSIIMLIQIVAIGRVNAETTSNSSSNFDVVFVLDASESMLKTDPLKLREEAVKLFIDMLHAQGDRAALVAFSGDIVKESSFHALNSDGSKAKFKELLTGIKLGDWTDIGLGLKRGVDILEKQHDGAKRPLIILLSDGKNDPDPAKDKDKKLSLNALNTALDIAKGKGYPIYTIGLNSKGGVDKVLLKDIADKTSG